MQSPFRKKYKNSNPIEAEYEDGFVLNESEQNDISIFTPGRNTFYDILHKTPEAMHGHMVRFSVWVNGDRVDIDWTKVPSNAKPIRFNHYEQDQNMRTGEVSKKRLVGITFGLEYLDKATNRNVQEVREIT